MPELRLLSVVRWERYVPDLPGNRASPQPFHFQLNASMSKEQARELRHAMEPLEPAPDAAPVSPDERRKAKVARYAAALEPYVKLGPDPLSLDGQPVKSLLEYLDAMSQLEFEAYFYEVGWSLQRINSVEGLTAFFSERLSGGFTTTPAPSSGPAKDQRAGQ